MTIHRHITSLSAVASASVCAALLASPAVAVPPVIGTNFGTVNLNGGNSIAVTSPGGNANQFTVGNSSLTITGAIARLQKNAATPNPTMIALGQILADNNGTPGTVLFNFTSASFGTATSNVVFNATTAGTSLVLAANTKYWFGVGDTEPFNWADNGTDASSNGTINDLYSTRPGNPPTWAAGSAAGTLKQFQLTGSIVPAAPGVPEPSAIVFGASFALLGGMGIARGRRRNGRGRMDNTPDFM